jgi:hypothetical protein|nr:MAG TPA: hypothetical protein [Caudoviricetes sp.]
MSILFYSKIRIFFIDEIKEKCYIIYRSKTDRRKINGKI